MDTSQNSDKSKSYQLLEKELNAEIMAITLAIKSQFPELSKYIDEMPLNLPETDDYEIKLKDLRDYHDSLAAMLAKYKAEHTDQK